MICENRKAIPQWNTKEARSFTKICGLLIDYFWFRI